MKKQFQYIYHSARYLLPFAVLFAVSFLLPKHHKFNYTFEVGQSWKSTDLYAPFDFAVLKAQAELARQADSLKATLPPCYYRADKIAVKQATLFTKRFNEKIKLASANSLYPHALSHTQQYLNVGRTILQNIYAKGIISAPEKYGTAALNEGLLIAQGNARTEQTWSDFLNIEDAETALIDALLRSNLPDGDLFLSLLNEKPALITPNILFSDSLSAEFHAAALQNFTENRGIVREGERLVSKREIVTERTAQKLQSLKFAYQQKELADDRLIWIRSGYYLLLGTLLFLFQLFLRKNAPSTFRSYRQSASLFLWVLIFSYLVYWIEQTELMSLYIVPFCIVPIVVKNFYNDLIALMTHFIVIAIISLLFSLGYDFFLMQLLAGIVVVIINVKTSYWSQFFKAIMYIMLIYVIVFIGIALLQQGTWRLDNWSDLGWIAGSVFLTLLSYPLVPLLERLFGFTSDITLEELGHFDLPLPKRLATEAPGTFQHSLQVANLAEAAATEIGANALLVKVAALYHDIGKIKNPTFFIENQQSQDNPHDALSPAESARIIIEHVTEGVALAKKHGLPPILIDFITTHHGTTRVEYFLNKAQQLDPDAVIDFNDFCYPGFVPRTKEQVVLMLADSIEAASKCLKNPTAADISDLVEKITLGKVSKLQFTHSDITFSELEKIKAVFKRLLKSIYHVRIEYPEARK